MGERHQWFLEKSQLDTRLLPYIRPKFPKAQSFLMHGLGYQCKLSSCTEIFRNYHVAECRKNVPNAIYNAHG